MIRPRLQAWLALAFVAAGLGFRLPQLARWELHVDESLYADVSRHVIERGDLLVNGAKSDKPPVLYWLQAPCLLVLGATETAARLPGLLAWLAAAWLLWRLLSARWGTEPALAGLAVWCFSPYGILFMPTGFTDPLMAAAGLAGLAFFAAERPFAAGLSLGLALACKQTGLLYLGPALLLLRGREDAKRFAQGYAWIAAPLLGWSALIANPRLGIWSRAAEYASAGVETAAGARFQEVFLQAWRSGGTMALNLGLLALAGLGLFAPPPYRAAKISALGLACYFAFLVFSHGQFFDRYWLWALPLLAVACAAGLWPLPQAARLPLALMLALGLAGSWQFRGRDWSYGAANQGFRGARQWCAGKIRPGDQIYLAGQAKPLGWKALFYFHAGKGQGLKQNEIHSLSEAKERGWVLAFAGDLKGRRADFDSGEGLLVWQLKGPDGL